MATQATLVASPVFAVCVVQPGNKLWNDITRRAWPGFHEALRNSQAFRNLQELVRTGDQKRQNEAVELKRHLKNCRTKTRVAVQDVYVGSWYLVR